MLVRTLQNELFFSGVCHMTNERLLLAVDFQRETRIIWPFISTIMMLLASVAKALDRSAAAFAVI